MNPFKIYFIPFGLFLAFSQFVFPILRPWSAKVDSSAVQNNAEHESPTILSTWLVFFLDKVFSCMSFALQKLGVDSSYFRVGSLYLIIPKMLLWPGSDYSSKRLGWKFMAWALLSVMSISSFGDKLSQRDAGRLGESRLWWLSLLVLFVDQFVTVCACVGVLRASPPEQSNQTGHFEDHVVEPIYLVTSPAFAPNFFKFIYGLWTPADTTKRESSVWEKDRTWLTVKLLTSMIAVVVALIGLLLKATPILVYLSGEPFGSIFETWWRNHYTDFFSVMFPFLAFNGFQQLRNAPSLVLHYAAEVDGIYYELERVSWFRNSIRLKKTKVEDDDRYIISRKHCAFTAMTDDQITTIAYNILDVAPGYDPLIYNCQATFQQLLARTYTNKNCPMLKTKITIPDDQILGFQWIRQDAEDYARRYTDRDYPILKLKMKRLDGFQDDRQRLIFRQIREEILHSQIKRTYEGQWSSQAALNEGWRNQRGNSLFIVAVAVFMWLRSRHPTSPINRYSLIGISFLVEAAILLCFVRQAVFFTSTVHARRFNCWIGLTQFGLAFAVSRPLEAYLSQRMGFDKEFKFIMFFLALVVPNQLCRLIFYAPSFHSRIWPRNVWLWVAWNDKEEGELRMLTFVKDASDATQGKSQSLYGSMRSDVNMHFLRSLGMTWLINQYGDRNGSRWDDQGEARIGFALNKAALESGNASFILEKSMGVD